MSTIITLPKLGVEMETALLNEWIAAEGAEVSDGEIIATLETEKVVFELPSPAAGLLHRTAVEGDEYAIGDVIGALAASAEEYAALRDGGTPDGAPAAAPVPASAPAAAASVAVAPATTPAPAAGNGGGPLLATPLARRVAAAHGVELSAVAGSGPRGAIRRRDVDLVLANQEATAPAPAPVAAPATPAAPAAPAPVIATGDTPYTVEKMTAMRRTIAQRMHHSMQSTAQMSDIREHDVTAVVALRNAAVARADVLGFKLSYSAIFARAAVMALGAVPELNSSLTEDNELRRYQRVDLGTAVAVPDGLLVPVVRGADRLSVRELNEQLATVIDRARTRTASAEELSGGTFTVTNFGSYGSHIGTPILLPPQVGIMGIGAMLDRPVVRDGELAVGKVMYVSLSVDHRVIDGETAGRFQNELGRLFADPDLLLYG